MSKLFFTDNGRVLRDHNEELTRWRRIKKELRLPRAAASADADLWILAAAYSGKGLPLRISVNGRAAGSLRPTGAHFQWYCLHLPAGYLRAGINTFVLECDAPAMNAWRPALACGASGGSYISFDRGKTWRSDRLGVYGVLTGEYVIRLRSQSPALRDSPPPGVVYCDLRHPRLAELRTLLPRSVLAQRDAWRRLLALRIWVATRWVHDPFGGSYCPWDAATILDWAANNRGHGGRGKTAMCVHFSVVLASFAAALGYRARCVAVTAGINTGPGHFVCEIFDPGRQKWVVHDANYDVHYEHDQPLSAVEISRLAAAGHDIRSMVRAGPGFPTAPRRVLDVFRKYFSTGLSYKLVAVWRRMDFITDPSVAAVHHGSIRYHEPDWIWQADSGIDRDRELGMFP